MFYYLSPPSSTDEIAMGTYQNYVFPILINNISMNNFSLFFRVALRNIK